jgi:hypothetical protein
MAGLRASQQVVRCGRDFGTWIDRRTRFGLLGTFGVNKFLSLSAAHPKLFVAERDRVGDKKWRYPHLGRFARFFPRFRVSEMFYFVRDVFPRRFSVTFFRDVFR